MERPGSGSCSNSLGPNKASTKST